MKAAAGGMALPSALFPALLLLLGLSWLSPAAALARNLGEYERTGGLGLGARSSGRSLRAARPPQPQPGELGLAGIPVVAAPGEKQPRYDTAYACEGKTLTIQCRQGEQIHLIRANYGRFSITICNDHGNTEWSVNCMSPKSLRVLHQKCSQQQNCSVMAHTGMFGDPCPGTLKYLEAHYQCMPVSTSTPTTRASPPWLMTSQPSVWSTKLPPGLLKPAAPPQPATGPTTAIQPTAAPPASASQPTRGPPTVPQQPPPQQHPRPQQPSPPQQLPPPRTHQPTQQLDGERERERETSLEPAQGPQDPQDTKGPDKDVATPRAPAPAPAPEEKPPEARPAPAAPLPPPSSTPLTSTVGSDGSLSSGNPWFQGELQLCHPVSARGLYWNWTRAGEVNVQACPGGATGVAKWRCTQGATWQTESPDLSECRSVWLTSLESRVIEGDTLISIANDLSQVTNSKTLYGGDMMTTTKILKAMAEKMAKDIQTFPDPQQREAIVTELLHGAVRTGSNLLDTAQMPSWRDLSYREQMLVATSLLIGLEENAFLVAEAVIEEKTVIEPFKNILLSVRVLETRSVGPTEQFPTAAALNAWDGRLMSDGDWLELPRGALLDNSDGGLVRLVFVAFDRLEEILQPKGDPVENSVGVISNVTRVLNSKVISASLGKGRHIQLSEPVRLTLKHLRTENVSNPSCVFWDYTMSTWSEEGCRVHSNNQTHTVCECEHLTNFAVLMDVHSTLLPPVHQTALQVITYVGCVVSVVCLVLAILTFQLFRGLKVKRNSTGNRLPRRHLCRRSCSPTSRSSSHSQMLSQLCSRSEPSHCQCSTRDESCSQMQDLCTESCTQQHSHSRAQVHSHHSQLCESFSQPHSLVNTQPQSQAHNNLCHNHSHLCGESSGETVVCCQTRNQTGPASCTQPHSHPCEEVHNRQQQSHCDTYGRTCVDSRSNTLNRSGRSCARSNACDTLCSQSRGCDGPNSLPSHLPQPHSCSGSFSLKRMRPPSQNLFCETRCDSASDHTCQIYNELSNHSRSHTPTHSCAPTLHSISRTHSHIESNYWSRRPRSRQRSARHDTSYPMEIPRVYSRALSDESPEYEYIS